MTSILTNTGAMVALQTLSMINAELTKTQADIATGKKIATAADDASIWAVTSIMQSDVDGFEAISESLSLGKATVSVARNASEKVTELLRDVKEKIVAAQGENIDRGKIQDDIDELEAQINSIIASAQFNGLNLIDGSGAGSVNVLSSLDRDATGSVTTNNIVVDRQDLSANANVGGTVDMTGATFDDATTAALSRTSGAVAFTDGAAGLGGELDVIVNGASIGTIEVAAGATHDNIASDVRALVTAQNIDGLTVSQTGNSLTFTNDGTIETVTVDVQVVNGANDMVGGSNNFAGAAANSTLAPDRTEVADSTTTHDGTLTITNAIANGDTEVIDLTFTFADATTTTVSYTANGDDTAINSAAGLANAINSNAAIANAGIVATANPASGAITISSTGPEDVNFTAQLTNTGAGGAGHALAWNDGLAVPGTFTVNAVDNTASTVGSGTASGKGIDLTLASGTTPTAGDAFELELRQDLDNDGVREADETVTFTYFVKANDTNNDIALGLQALVEADSRFDNVYINPKTVIDPTTTDVVVRIDSTGEAVDVALTKSTGGSAGGGLALLADIDVTTTAGANQALADIEVLIQTAVDASAAFGSSENRIDIQTEFVQSLVDAMKSGIGALVDTDMEAASARLQALQVQQQLGTQALAIANATPQNILALFQ